MLFSSLSFIFGFLPAFLAVYFLTPVKYRNIVLLMGSLVFYGIGPAAPAGPAALAAGTAAGRRHPAAARAQLGPGPGAARLRCVPRVHAGSERLHSWLDSAGAGGRAAAARAATRCGVVRPAGTLGRSHAGHAARAWLRQRRDSGLGHGHLPERPGAAARCRAESVRGNLPCPLGTPEHTPSSLQILAIARAMAAFCA